MTVVASFPTNRQPLTKPAAGYESLTAREREVLRLTAEGLTSKEMGERLGISPRTADVHRAHVIRKLGLRNRVEVVRFALKAGLAPMDLSTGA